MSDYSELKRLSDAATPGPWVKTIDGVMPEGEKFGIFGNFGANNGEANRGFIAAANPAVVLALIADVEGLRAQHGRDSAELRSLCQARDDARKDRDQLKAEVARSTEREIMQLAEIEELRKDAELHQQIQRAAKDLPFGWEIRVCVERESGYVELWDQDGCEVDFPNSCESLALTVSDAIDGAMTNGEQP